MVYAVLVVGDPVLVADMILAVDVVVLFGSVLNVGDLLSAGVAPVVGAAVHVACDDVVAVDAFLKAGPVSRAVVVLVADGAVPVVAGAFLKAVAPVLVIAGDPMADTAALTTGVPALLLVGAAAPFAASQERHPPFHAAQPSSLTLLFFRKWYLNLSC